MYHLPDLDVAETAAEATPVTRTDVDDRPPEIFDSGGADNGATDIPDVPVPAMPSGPFTAQAPEIVGRPVWPWRPGTPSEVSYV